MMDEYTHRRLLDHTDFLLDALQSQAQITPSRALSLAITKVEEARHWLIDPGILVEERKP